MVIRLLPALTLVFLWVFPLSATQAQEMGAAPLRAHDSTLAGDQQHTRLVVRFDGKPEPSWFLLRDPHRLVIDFAETDFDLDPAGLKSQGLVSHVRYGNIRPGRSRMILTVPGPFTVDRVEVMKNETSPGSRLIVDISAADREQFEAALRRHMHVPEATAKVDRPGPAGSEHHRRFTVVIDAGHGGIDGGTQGVDDTPEKTITLAFALELRKKLQETGAFDVVMTRESDEFVSLDDRVRIAREHSADLFISLHADAIRLKSFRGATIYTVSDKASDAEAALTAARENLSDALAGIEVQEEKDDVADILVDLTRRETHAFSMRFADYLLVSLSSKINMIDTNPHRYAGFRVLRAVDVPSVLIELGYLSNPQDEKQLRDPEWRTRAAESIVTAVEKFAGTTRVRAGG